MAAKHVDFTLDRPRRIRFTIRAGRDLEKSARALGYRSISDMMTAGPAPDLLTVMAWHGLKEEDKKVTEAKAEELIQNFIDNDGDVEVLFDTLIDAMSKSGLYKKPEAEKPADPTPA